MTRKAVLALVWMVWVAELGLGQQWAIKMFDTTRHDFGTVARAAKAEFAFTLTNLYLEDVHLAGVRSSCGCTTPRIEKPWLKTYEQGAVIAHFNTDAFTGQHGATLTVTIDKPYYAEVQLQVRGYIRSDLVFYPGSVDIGKVDQGTPTTRTVRIQYAGGSHWRVLEVRTPNPNVTAEIHETQRGTGQVSYELRVHLAPTAPPGRIHDHLILVTNDRSRPQVPLAVEGLVEPTISVTPSRLFLGVLEPGQRVTKQLVVRGKRPFRILSVESPDGTLELPNAPAPEAKLVHVLPVTFVAGSEPGRIVQTLRIQTDLGADMPDLSAIAVVAR